MNFQNIIQWLIGDDYVQDIVDEQIRHQMVLQPGESTYEGYFVQYHTPHMLHPFNEPREFLMNMRGQMQARFRENVQQERRQQGHIDMRIFATMRVRYRLRDDTIITLHHNSGTLELGSIRDVDVDVDMIIDRLLRHIEDRQQGPSGLRIENVESLEVHIGRYEPLAGGTYMKLPEEIENKHAVINVQNRDEACFKWSVLSAMYPAEKNPQRVSKYIQYEKELDWTGVTYPMPIKDIPKFEEKNNLSINVYGYDEKYRVYLISRSKQVEFTQHIDLLYMKKTGRDHYCWIKNLSRLIRSQLTLYEHRQYLCKVCLKHYPSEQRLQAHLQDCISIADKYGCSRVRMPTEETKIVSFKPDDMKECVPYVIYADFEAILPRLRNQYKGEARLISQHVASMYSYVVIDTVNNRVFSHKTYGGKDVVENLVTSLQREACRIIHKTKQKFIPIFMHNFRGYDSHLIIKALKPHWLERVSVIPTNTQKYLSISLDKLRFVDSLQFWQSSLDKLTQSLQADDLTTLKQVFPEHWNLLTNKMHYPYEYINHMKKYKETKLPDIKDFYSELTDKHIKNEQYEACQKIWQIFNIKTMYEYTEVYVKTDVCLLADFFEKFRRMCRNDYRLDPAYYLSAPGFTYDAALKMTKVELELFTEDQKDMHDFCTEAIRGGLSVAVNRFVEANNPYLSSYNKLMETIYLIYLDINNLYGQSMVQSLPIGDFRWATEVELKEFTSDKIMTMNDDGELGCFIEADIEYPIELHNVHSDLPFLPERRVVKDEMLSPYCNRIKNKYGITSDKTPKLLNTLMFKEKYKIHYRHLKLCLKHGLKLGKIYRILFFKQTKWLKSFIEFNTQKRKNSKHKFEKDMYKLLNNSMFGKTIENVYDRCKVHIATEQKASKLLKNKLVQSFQIINKQYVQVNLSNNVVYLNKPIYVGVTVLELSKMYFYAFMYDYIKVKYRENAEFVYGDTDSYILKIKTPDIYKDMKEDKQYFDTSNYPKDHELYDGSNRMELGLLKDELGGKLIKRVVALKSKMYIVETDNKKITKAKGVHKSNVEKFTMENYLDVLQKGLRNIGSMKSIQSYNHLLYTIDQPKITLDVYDNKRYILKGGCKTLPYGHYKIPVLRELEMLPEE